MSNIDADLLKDQYAKLTNAQLDQEYQKIISIPNARTNIDALTKMSALIEEYEVRGLEMPNKRKTSNTPGLSSSLIIGFLLVVGGLVLSAVTDRVFYGAIIIGVIMVVKGFIPSDN